MYREDSHSAHLDMTIIIIIIIILCAHTYS